MQARGVTVEFDPTPTTSAAGKASAKVSAAGSTSDGRWRRLAPQSEWSDGADQQREPIYVIDPQGRIVRTLHK
ncbi:MAG: hypothetical protein OXE49_13350 [Gemmatimonadetes bacterium]|nr:hypothetical protein [Gemmatimonadota bacterium]